MIVRTLESLNNTRRHIRWKTNEEWSSRRYLLLEDGFPFGTTYTQLAAGGRMENEYRHHFEACVCIAGRGRLHDLKSGEVHDLYPGVLYALNKGERHILEAIEELTLISIFSPPLVGPEVHDENGSYPDLTRG